RRIRVAADEADVGLPAPARGTRRLLAVELRDGVEVAEEPLGVRKPDVRRESHARRAVREARRLDEELDDADGVIRFLRRLVVLAGSLGEQTAHALSRANAERVMRIELPHGVADRGRRELQLARQAMRTEGVSGVRAEPLAKRAHYLLGDRGGPVLRGRMRRTIERRRGGDVREGRARPVTSREP